MYRKIQKAEFTTRGINILFINKFINVAECHISLCNIDIMDRNEIKIEHL